jgi:hypothetical protein
MKRSTVLLRLAGALLVLAAVLQLPVPAAQAATNCFVGGMCQPCSNGGKRPCGLLICDDGSETITGCGSCSFHCIPPG